MARDRVYLNLHRKVWSVQDGRTRRVRAHWSAVAILDVTFKVSAAGRERVLRERRKNVHSFACGTAFEGVELDAVNCPPGPGVAVTYNPYRAPFFYDRESGREVVSADAAFLCSDTRRRRARTRGPIWPRVIAYGVVYGPRNVFDQVAVDALKQGEENA